MSARFRLFLTDITGYTGSILIRGLPMDERGGNPPPVGCSGVGKPIPLKAMPSLLRIAVEPLSEGTAARVMRAYGEQEIQVNAAIPSSLHQRVAAHCLAQHPRGCYTMHCVAARTWLRMARPTTAVSA